MPGDWSDDDSSSYAQDAADQAVLCDDIGTCDPPPPVTVQDPPVKTEEPPIKTEQPTSKPSGGVKGETLNEAARRNRSAGTMYLTWVRLELEGCLARCRVTKLPFVMPKTEACARHHLCCATRVAHVVHNFPIDFGFDDPWPTSVDQYDDDRANITVRMRILKNGNMFIE